MARKHLLVTLTFKTEVCPKEGFHFLATRLRRYKNKFKDFVFYPEYGLANARLHFHGKISYNAQDEKSVMSFLGNWKRYKGFIYISNDENSDILSWHVYCIKDQYKWKQKRIHKYNYHKYLCLIKRKLVKDIYYYYDIRV